MSYSSTFMGLRIWDSLADRFNHSQLATNLNKLDAHDHTSSKGTQIPQDGLADSSISNSKIQDSSIGISKLTPAAIVAISSASMPTGTILPFVGASAPAGFLIADGSVINRTTYAALWNTLRNGTSSSPYGNGNGTTTFSLPDLRNRVAGGAASFAAPMGATAGADSISLNSSHLPSHTHSATLSDPGHSHATKVVGPGAAGINDAAGSPSDLYTESQTTTSVTGITISNGYTGGNVAHENRQPTLYMNMIIKT